LGDLEPDGGGQRLRLFQARLLRPADIGAGFPGDMNDNRFQRVTRRMTLPARRRRGVCARQASPGTEGSCSCN
jgi:hypothetical protein